MRRFRFQGEPLTSHSSWQCRAHTVLLAEEQWHVVQLSKVKLKSTTKSNSMDIINLSNLKPLVLRPSIKL